MNAYASVKLLTDLTRPVSIALLVNRAPGKRWPKRRNNGWPRPAGVFWAWPCAVWATCRKTAQCRNPPRGANRSCWPSRPVRPVCTCGKRRGAGKPCAGAAARGGVGRDFSKYLIQRNQENDAEVTIGGTEPAPGVKFAADCLTRKQNLNLSLSASDIEGQASVVDALSNWPGQAKFDGSPEAHAWLVNTLEFLASWH